MKQFTLEVSNDNVTLGLLEGDEVLVSTLERPRGNGKDMALFEIAGEQFISAFTRIGNQIMLLGERIQVVRADRIKILGKVIGGSYEENKKAVAATTTLTVQ